MKKLRFECKLRLQLCAILSQTQNHIEALDNAKKSCKIIHQLFKDLLILCYLYIRKIEKKELKKLSAFSAIVKSGDKIGSKSITDEEDSQDAVAAAARGYPKDDNGDDEDSEREGANFLEESVSMLERTSLKLYPVVKEVIKRMINENLENKDGQMNEQDTEVIRLMQMDESKNFFFTQCGVDMRSVLGFLNQNEWI
jgi:hypothetical protein